ncbi:MAG: recombinase family protein [Alphaproteobacteria bacterium]|nr:recombinase family protein [Alphaproteobacteria bacterium]
MSTEHQRYSTENQADAIRSYAARRGIQIVKTYADEGKSGLRLDGRDALKRLIADVENGDADFETILVYDVSRWGRFQDADESAYYEYLCKRAGITVQYCAEQFENDGSPVSTIVKGVKRAMAGEYSRELSAKVFAGQCRLIELGFRQGGPAGFGLRRHLVDQAGAPKAELAPSEHKSIQTDRVILVPGPADEIEKVRWIYRAFVHDGKSEAEIATDLNVGDVLSDRGRPWTRGTVHQVLINEKYIGNNVWNRTSFKLKRKHVQNSPEMWIRSDGVFEPIVDRQLFNAARAIIEERSYRMPDDEMLQALRSLLETQGYLSGILIDEADNVPSSSSYRGRFGSLLRAYTLIGYTPDRDFSYVEINRAIRQRHPSLVSDAVAGIEAAGGEVALLSDGLLLVNNEITTSVVIARCATTVPGSLRWFVRMDTGLLPDITIVARLDRANEAVLDYYLLPRLDMTIGRLRLAEANGASIDCYRFDSLEYFFELAARTDISEVA